MSARPALAAAAFSLLVAACAGARDDELLLYDAGSFQAGVLYLVAARGGPPRKLVTLPRRYWVNEYSWQPPRR